ncbi:MAG: hypothetical protein KDA46_07360, partial [Parvularculaceae bacterium]|nr:hypothetical protein [Parvularculaceae bacterium]
STWKEGFDSPRACHPANFLTASTPSRPSHLMQRRHRDFTIYRFSPLKPSAELLFRRFSGVLNWLTDLALEG